MKKQKSQTLESYSFNQRIRDDDNGRRMPARSSRIYNDKTSLTLVTYKR